MMCGLSKEAIIHIFCQCNKVCYKNTVYYKLQIPIDSIKIIYNPDLSEHEIKIISIYKYTMWQVRNLVRAGKKVEQLNFNNLYLMREFFTINFYELSLKFIKSFRFVILKV